MARKKSFDVTDDLRFQNTRVQPVTEEAAEDGAQTPGYTMLNAKDITPSPFNEGLDMDSIDSYVRSMKETGIIEPIVVYDLGNGKYEILSGHQRYEAWCNRLGNRTIRAVILPYEKDPVKRFTAHTEANVLTRKKDLRFWLTRIKHAKQVLHDSGFVGSKAEELKKISEMLNGISKTQLYRYESFEKLIPELQDFEAKGCMSANTLYLAVSLDDKQQMEVAERVRALQNARVENNPEQLDDPDYCKRHKIDIDGLYHDEERIQKVAEHILEHHRQHTYPQGRDIYTAIFAVDSIKTLGQYYDIFKELNGKRPEEDRYKITAIFSYGVNEDMDGKGDEHSAELLSRIMDDYNEMFNTSFTLEGFDAYRKDISKRLKQKNLPQVDILLVVNMMLTGFDAKPLNTLYLDKNLIWHTLVQAYSRTNRVDKPTKQFGQIITYRNIKKWQDDALRLFSGDGDPNEYLLENYEYYVQKWINQEPVLRKITPTVDEAGQLQSEDEIRMFIIAFRTMVGTLATLKTFSKFDWDDLAVVLGEEEYEGFKSWYLYYKDNAEKNNTKVPVPVDVDFDIELVRTDRINVVYILNLLKSANKAGKTEQEREADLDLILREIERSDNESLRAKKDIMEEFVRTRFYDLPEDADIQAAFEEFETERQKAEIEEFAYENGVEYQMVNDILVEYMFNGRISEEAIRKRLEAYKLGILKITVLTEKIQDFIEHTHIKYKAEGE